MVVVVKRDVRLLRRGVVMCLCGNIAGRSLFLLAESLKVKEKIVSVVRNQINYRFQSLN